MNMLQNVMSENRKNICSSYVQITFECYGHYSFQMFTGPLFENYIH